MKISRFLLSVLTVLAALSFSLSAHAGIPLPWQMGFQPAATPIMETLNKFHNELLIMITAIVIFVFFLLLYTCIRFSRKANPTPSKTAHNTILEIIWTVIPVAILIVMAIPSFKSLYFIEKIEKPEMVLKVVGHQWYWQYEYPGEQPFGFDSYMIRPEDLKPGQHRLLDVDNHVVLPVDTTIQLIITSADVMHSWAVPAFATKTDAVPGRINEAWIRVTKPGIYYGQCSELCGVGHGFMPIKIEVVSKEAYQAWLVSARKKFASSHQMLHVASK